MQKPIKIATHGGKFHADEVMAIAILQLVYKHGEVIRTRDPELIASVDIAVDVGGGVFDHHQKGGNGHRLNADGSVGVPYSSAGLVWKHYGIDAVVDRINTMTTMSAISFSDWIALDAIVAAIDAQIMEPIDAIDNGIERGPSELSFSSIISALNPVWFLAEQDENLCNVAFDQAVEIARSLLVSTINAEIGKQKAIDIVEEAFDKAVTGDRGYMVLDKGLPWMSQLEIIDTDRKILFVVYPTEDGKWQLRTVPVKAGEFGALKDLPEAWAGLRDADLQAVSGVADATFCHNGRFIGGAVSKEGAMQMAELALL